LDQRKQTRPNHQPQPPVGQLLGWVSVQHETIAYWYLKHSLIRPLLFVLSWLLHCYLRPYKMSNQYINAVYYPSWRCYKERPPSCLDTASITHIFYAFIGYVSKAQWFSQANASSVNEDGTLRVRSPTRNPVYYSLTSSVVHRWLGRQQ
jgi:hypothetical protein